MRRSVRHRWCAAALLLGCTACLIVELLLPSHARMPTLTLTAQSHRARPAASSTRHSATPLEMQAAVPTAVPTAMPIAIPTAPPQRSIEPSLLAELDRSTRDAPRLSDLLNGAGRRGSSATASVTALLEYAGDARLYAQLGGLLRQSLPPEHVWVVTYGSADGGAAARRVISMLTPNTTRTAMAVVSASGEGARAVVGYSRLARLALALQASTDHVLLLDPAASPGPRLVHTLSRASEVLGGRAAVGADGWRAARPRNTQDAPLNAPDEAAAGESPDNAATDAMVAAAVGATGIDLPAPGVPRLVEADVLRGSWLMRTKLVALLFREALPATADGTTTEPLEEEAR